MPEDLYDSALAYHRYPKPGKLAIHATKPLANQRDLALAYSPGVAAASQAIVSDPKAAYELTVRANLVAVVSNGTAVLGLGPIGALAAKPVMEGKAVLFKKFADIDVFDIEIDERDPDKFVDIVASLEPTFGAINLEDIKAPECFEIERKLKARLDIPVFHDDQHGTAICVGAAILNGLRVVGKKLEDVKLVASGAGAAGLACLDLLFELGLPRENVLVVDRVGVIHTGRKRGMDAYKARFARSTRARTLAQAVRGADVFLGLSAPGVLEPKALKTMAQRPLVLALANPEPEILPEAARMARPEVVIATGRSDYPNQVNNVLCFPFIFRAALDVGATRINTAMKLACVRAIADLALAEPSDIAAAAYGDEELRFGPEYILPKPFDPRLIVEICPAVAKAAMDSGVATRPIADLDAYRDELFQVIFRTGYVMKGIFERAKRAPRRVVYAAGEEPRILRAVQVVCDEGIARPILIGRRRVVAMRIERLGLRLEPEKDFELVDPEDDPRYRAYWTEYHRAMERRGVSPAKARAVLHTEPTAIAALMVRRGEADVMLAGPVGVYREHLKHVRDVIGLAEGVQDLAALQMLVLSEGIYFLADTNVVYDPDAEQIAEMTILAAKEVRRFGIEPKVALLSHTSFGGTAWPSAVKMREALTLIQSRAPDLEVEGEMQADLALSEAIRAEIFPNSRLKGQANLLIMPNLDAANIAFAMVEQLAQGVSVGPVLLGAALPAHILNRTVTVRGTVNMSALAVVHAQLHAEGRAPAALPRRAGS